MVFTIEVNGDTYVDNDTPLLWGRREIVHEI
jgi:hypothetical protein